MNNFTCINFRVYFINFWVYFISLRAVSYTHLNHEISIYLSKQGFETLGMNIGGTVNIQDIKITMVNSLHSSDMDFIEEVNAGGSSAGFILELENGRKIYHAGDTGIFSDMRYVINHIYNPDIEMCIRDSHGTAIPATRFR